MNSHQKAVLVAALLSMALAACSGQTGSPTSAAPEAGASQAQSAAAQTQGAVQRDYPSATEEAAFKLNYPVFLAYGEDSARVTPFFPGSSERPVSVKLAPNAAGYSLAAEGTQCAFPIDYALKSLSGKQLGGGEYKDGSVVLAGWDAQTGDAVLTLRMADDAKNNYGCNLVVNKK